MNDSLFRPQVLAARQGRMLGRVTLAQPLRLWMLAFGATAACLVVIGLLALGSFHRKARVTGELVPDRGLVIVTSPASGVVTRLFGEEGGQVLGDAPLAAVAVPRAIPTGEDAGALVGRAIADRRASAERLQASELAELDVEARGYARQLATARAEHAQITQELATRAEQIRIAGENARVFTELAERQLASRIESTQQQQALLDMMTARQSLERVALGTRRTIEQLEQAIDALGPRRETARAALARDRAVLDQERVTQAGLGGVTVKAPVPGLVTMRLVEPGQGVAAGQPLMTLLPQGSRLLAQLTVPSAAIGFVKPGDEVVLRYRAFPHQKFGHQRGTVVRVSRSPLAPLQAHASPGATAPDAQYRVMVRLESQTITAYGRAEPLRPGMAIDADILGEKHRLYELVLEPLYSVRGKS